MISDNLVQNLFDRSNTQMQTNGETYILIVELPNTYSFSVNGDSIEECTLKAKCKIKDLESYLERDRKFYGYDLENEFKED